MESSGSIVPLIIALVFFLAIIVGWWVLFEKAGKPGWMAIIPILSTIVLFNIAGKPWWWILLLFIPLVNVIVLFVMWVDFAKAYGQDTLFAILLLFFPFIMLPILAFGPAQYVGANR